MHKDMDRLRENLICTSFIGFIDTGHGRQSETPVPNVEERPGPRSTKAAHSRADCLRLWPGTIPTIVRDEGECGFLTNACASVPGGNFQRHHHHVPDGVNK